MASPANSFTLLRKALAKRHILGVTRIADATPLDRLGIPVVTVSRPITDRQQITVCQGKGRTYRHALLGAMMETVERFSAAEHPLSSSEKAIEGRRVSKERGFVYPDENSKLFPAASVFFPYVVDRNDANHGTAVRPNTSGLAAGGSSEQALIGALIELIERHSVSQFFQFGFASLVDWFSLPHCHALDLYKRFRASSVDVIALDLSNYTPFACFKVYTLDRIWCTSNMATSGQAAHWDPAIALERALLEAAQARVAVIQSNREDLKRRRGNSFTYADKAERFQYMASTIPIAKSAVKIGEISNQSSFRPLEHVLTLLETDRAAGSVHSVDLTHPEIGLPVRRVFIEGYKDTFVEKHTRLGVSSAPS
ncbi:YcaO-like family protein [Agrobacterium sp. CCNWLW32]|uniref:YcaO-like family protein n=1 Tax=unclassified Agrobacterium TaxID=2632611 RepID=UPI00300FFFAD